nr:hypothetical protein Itr_chr14CG23260 [Ipomoea trifida]
MCTCLNSSKQILRPSVMGVSKGVRVQCDGLQDEMGLWEGFSVYCPTNLNLIRYESVAAPYKYSPHTLSPAYLSAVALLSPAPQLQGSIFRRIRALEEDLRIEFNAGTDASNSMTALAFATQRIDSDYGTVASSG